MQETPTPVQGCSPAPDTLSILSHSTSPCPVTQHSEHPWALSCDPAIPEHPGALSYNPAIPEHPGSQHLLPVPNPWDAAPDPADPSQPCRGCSGSTEDKVPLGGCEVCSKGTEGHLQQELSCSEQMAREHLLGARRSPAGLSVTIYCSGCSSRSHVRAPAPQLTEP